MRVIAMGADLVGWVSVHGVRHPDGDLSPRWCLASGVGAAIFELARDGGALQRDPSGVWKLVTDGPALPVVISRASASGSALEFRLRQAPHVGEWVLDVSPWTLVEVLGPTTADAVTGAAFGTLRADLIARVVEVQDMGGVYVRHLVPGVAALAEA